MKDNVDDKIMKRFQQELQLLRMPPNYWDRIPAELKQKQINTFNEFEEVYVKRYHENSSLIKSAEVQEKFNKWLEVVEKIKDYAKTMENFEDLKFKKEEKN